jgi:hypothetical protein
MALTPAKLAKPQLAFAVYGLTAFRRYEVTGASTSLFTLISVLLIGALRANSAGRPPGTRLPEVRAPFVTAIGAALVLAFGAYEGGLYLVTFALGGEDAFTPAIVGHVALLNLGWTVGLVGTYEILRYSGAITAEGRRVPSAPFPI